MAVNAIFGSLRDKVRSVYNNFFYNGEEEPVPSAPAAYEPPVEYTAQQTASQYGGQTVFQQTYQQPQQPQQVVYQQPQQQPVYQQQAYQQPQQPVYQQPQPELQRQAQPRNRRMWAHQQENNIVDIGPYQQAAAASQGEAAAPAAEGQQAVRIINARSMGDCRSAITLLRNGDAVLIVLENVADPAEMRRLVDTLSGACYSLTATITKVSRYGVYLLAPQSMAVYADQTTNQMNGAPARQPQQRAYQQPAYAGPQYAPQQNGYQQPQQAAYGYAPPQQEFTPRAAASQENFQSFYARPTPQAAAAPSFSAQPAGYGYAPDETAAMEQ